MFNKQTEYELSSDLNNYLIEVYGERSNIIKDILYHIESLAGVYSLEVQVHLDELELRILEAINRAKDVEDSMLFIEAYIKAFVREFLKTINIRLEEDDDLIPYEILESILNSLNNIFNLDHTTSRDLLVSVDTDIVENVYTFASIVEEYGNIDKETVYEVTESVGDNFFIMLIKHLKAIVYRGDQDFNPKDIKKLTPLINADRNFAYCRIVKNGLFYGFSKFKFNSYEDSLYNILDSYHGEVKNMAYEIYATNFLSEDKPIKDPSDLEKVINIKSLAEKREDYLDFLDNLMTEYEVIHATVEGMNK